MKPKSDDHLVTTNSAADPVPDSPSSSDGPDDAFAETVAVLRGRAQAGEGNHRQAELCLRAAEELHRQAGLYEMQIEGVKRCTPKGKRSGIRLSHLAHAVTRTIQGRDRYLAEAEAALRSPCAAL